MKLARILLLCICTVLVAHPSLALVPRAVIAELATSVTCGYCPQAYSGLEIMKGRYDRLEFNALRYYTTAGVGTAETSTRIAYYGVTGYPTCIFNGTVPVVGGGDAANDGSAYDPVVLGMLDDATAVKLAVTDFTLGSPASATVEVELDDDLADIANTYVRLFLVEDNVIYSTHTYQDVVRRVLPQEALTIDLAGETQSVTRTFDIDAAWNPANLWVAAIVQRDGDRHIHQSATSRPQPAYAFRFYALGDRVAIDGAEHVFGDVVIFNMGIRPDVYDLMLDTAALPAGWTASIVHEGVPQPSVALALDPGESATVQVSVDPSGGVSGSGLVLLVMTPQNRTGERRLAYTVITPDTEVLLVDDDGAESYETDYYAPALAGLGRIFAIWDRNAAPLTGALLASFDVVVWNLGWAFPTLDASDRAALGEYLDGGGRLFVSGQDLGWELNSEGGAAYAWYQQYLGAAYIADDTNYYTLSGVPGDPISNGLVLTIQGGDGADNQDYPSDIDAYGVDSRVILTYDAQRNGAVAKSDGVSKVVYFAFGYEAIDNAADRELVMQRVIGWLTGTGTDAPAAPAPGLVLRQNVPNPFNPTTEIAFRLDGPADLRLEILDARGRLLRVLAEGPLPAGEHRVVWDGRNAAGRALPSGVYFYRVVTPDAAHSRRMVLVK
ncbi:MAG: Omp28-related outer membrane protein [Candidatus Krumholzibacteriota bacterium]|nr:Omp28-related outer membrane protein [Candidatus Krumholzibacteriota bacterium]